MSEITYQTTTGRYGAAKPSNPIPPDTGNDYLVSLECAAAADGILFWFWRLEKVDPPAIELVHGMNAGTALCGAGAPSEWVAGVKWSSDEAIVTCGECLAILAPKPEQEP